MANKTMNQYWSTGYYSVAHGGSQNIQDATKQVLIQNIHTDGAITLWWTDGTNEIQVDSITTGKFFGNGLLLKAGTSEYYKIKNSSGSARKIVAIGVESPVIVVNDAS